MRGLSLCPPLNADRLGGGALPSGSHLQKVDVALRNVCFSFC